MPKISRKLTFLIAHMCIVTIFCLCGCGKADGVIKSERNIIVEDLNGSASVASADKGESDAYKGRQLISGDAVAVASDSDMTLKIDEDKHLFADSDTRFSVEATGKIGATETKITVAEGCTLIGIDNKLGDGETFNVSTPNATMAVRGTVFYVTVAKNDSDIGVKTELVVKEGTVEAKTIENGEERKDIIGEGQTVTYFGQAPVEEQNDDHADTAVSEEPIETISPDKIPQDRDGSKGLNGVYRSGGVMVVIAEGVPYAYNRADGIIIDKADVRPFCVATVGTDGEPFFAREKNKVSDTQINDFAYRDDINDHVADMDYYLDGDTLYYHQRIYEANYDECIVLKRTGENPVDVYMSLIGTGQTEAEINRKNDIDLEQYFADMGYEGMSVSGKAYTFDAYYKDDPEYIKLTKELTSWGASGDVLELSSPVTYDGHTFSVCILGYCDVKYDNTKERVFASGESELYGYFESFTPSSDPNDITKELMGEPLYIFYVADIR